MILTFLQGSLRSFRRFRTVKISSVWIFKIPKQRGIMKMCRATEVFVEKGIEQGTDVINRRNEILLEANRLDDLKRATKDKKYQKKLMKELLPKEPTK